MIFGLGRKKSEEELFIEDIKSLISFLNNDTCSRKEKIETIPYKLRLILEKFSKIEKNSLNRVVEIIPILLRYRYISKANFQKFVSEQGGLNEPDFLKTLRESLLYSVNKLENKSVETLDKISEIQNILRPTLIKTVVFINFLIKLDRELQSIESKVLK